MNLTKILFTVMALITSATAWSVPVTWSANGHQYEVIQAPAITWAAARAQAQSKGAGWDLATITSLDEQLFIANMLTPLTTFSFTEYLIGGYDATDGDGFNSGWAWVTGEAFSWTFWGAGEPNSGAPVEGFIGLDNRFNSPNWGWNDYTGGTHAYIAGFVAERHTAVAAPSVLGLLGFALLGVVRSRRR